MSFAIGEAHSHGIQANMLGVCAGSSYYGRCGRGSESSFITHSEFLPGQAWQKLVAGPYHSCGINGEGKLFCWGFNYRGQLGVPTAWSDEVLEILRP